MQKIKDDITLKISGCYLEIILSLILILIIIIFYNSHMNNKIYNDLYEGLWISSDDFCSRTGIDGMMIYIGPHNYSDDEGEKHARFDPRCQERKAYLVMYSNDSVIANKKFNIVFQGSIFDKINPFAKQIIYKKIYLYDPDNPDLEANTADQIEEEIDDISLISLKKIMPLIQTAEINISEGRMTWTGDDGIAYADLFKDNLSSQVGKTI